MSKVLVDRELLEQTVKHLEWDGDGSQTVMQYAQQGDRLAEELAEAIAQPAEAGRPGDWEWLKLMAEVAEQDRPWDPRLGMTDVEMAYAQSASPSKVLELIAALSSVTAERDAALAENARLIEDRARFPDKPDDIGNMIRAHIGNLKIGQEQAESCARKLAAEADLLRKDAERWRYVSLQGDDMHWLNLLRVDLEDFGGNINAAVDALIDSEAPAKDATQ